MKSMNLVHQGDQKHETKYKKNNERRQEKYISRTMMIKLPHIPNLYGHWFKYRFGTSVTSRILQSLNKCINKLKLFCQTMNQSKNDI